MAKAAKKPEQKEVVCVSPRSRAHVVFDKLYNGTIQTLGVFLDNLSFLMSKMFKPLVYALEGLGVYYILYMLTKYEIGLQLIKAGNIDAGKAYMDALIAAASASNTIVLGMAVALPTFMGAMKVAKRKLIP